MEPIQAIAPPQTPNTLDGIDGSAGFLANPDKLLHRFHPLVLPAEVVFANRFAHEFRNGRLPAPRARVKRIPEVVVQIQLSPPHDVYYTSREYPHSLEPRIQRCNSGPRNIRAVPGDQREIVMQRGCREKTEKRALHAADSSSKRD